MKPSILFILFSLQFLPAQSHNNLIDEYLREQLKEYQSFSYEILTNMNDFQIVEINSAQPLKLNRNSAIVPVIINKQGVKKKYSLALRLLLYDSILVASSDLTKKKKLNADDFKLNLVDVSNLNGTPIKDRSAVNSFRLNCSLKKGDVLLREIIEEVPVVYPGDIVTAELRKGNVVVSFNASVRQEGNTGELIKIVTAENKIFNARIVDNKNVTIE